MPALTIDLDSKTYGHLCADALKYHISPEEMVARCVTTVLIGIALENESPNMTKQEFQERAVSLVMDRRRKAFDEMD